MGLRFRKSIKLGGGARLNLSKSGVGYSVGTKGARITKKAGGGTRTTISAPGTGISYVKESGNTKRSRGVSRGESISDSNTNEPKKRKTWLWVLGWVFIFPVPLTILMLRKKDIKPLVKYGIIAAGWIAYFLLGMFGGSGSSTETTTRNQISNSSEVVENTSEIIENISETVGDISEIGFSETEEEAQVIANVLPDTAEDKDISRMSSAESMETIDKEDNIVAAGGGTTTLPASTANGITESIEQNVGGTKRTMNLRVTHPRDDDNNIGNEWSYITQVDM